MHTEAKKKLDEYLSNIIANLKFDIRGYPVIPQLVFSDMDKASSILAKEHLPFDFVNLYALFISEAWKAYEQHPNPPEHADISDERLVKVKKSLNEQVNYIIYNYPHNYIILIHLPNVKINPTIKVQITDNISVYQISDVSSFYSPQAAEDLGAALAGLNYGPSKPIVGEAYISINAFGWTSGYEGNLLLQDAISEIKRLFAAMTIMDFIKRADSIGLDMTIVHNTALIYKAGEEKNERPIKFKLPYYLGEALSSIQIEKKLVEKPTLPFLPLNNGCDSLLNTIGNNIKPLKKLLSTSSADTKRIHAALDWFCECLINRNETFKYILACISLEALLGENIKGVSIGQILADRTAFMLANTASLRKEYQDKIRKLYEKRSNLVHGNDLRIETHEQKDLYELMNMVSGLIRKEIFNWYRSVNMGMFY